MSNGADPSAGRTERASAGSVMNASDREMTIRIV